MSIADDETNWGDLAGFENLGDNFERLRPKVFRLMMDWSASSHPHHWVRAHNMIDQARSRGVELIIVTFKKPNATDVIPAWGYAPAPTRYELEITKTVREFAGKVDVWGPANEPNTEWLPYNGGAGPVKLAGYYQALREVVQVWDPTALITSPDFLDGASLQPISTYVNAYKDAGGGWGSVAAFHPYNGVQHRSMATINNYVSLIPAQVPIWVTEVGAHYGPSHYGNSLQDQNDRVWWLINVLGNHPRVTRIGYYHMRDHSPGWDTALMDTFQTPRPSWYTWCGAVHGDNPQHPDCSTLDTRRPAAISRDGGIISLFARGSDNAVWHKSFTPGPGWSGWQSLGGTMTSGPTAFLRSGDVINVAVRGTDNAAHHKSYTPVQGWSAWQSLDGSLTSAPVGVVRPGEVITLFARESNLGLTHKSFTPPGPWTNWVPLDNTLLASDPAAISRPGDVISVFALGADKSVLHKSFTPGTGWSAWQSLGGTLTSGPTAISRDGGIISVFARGLDGTLHHRSFTPGTGWSAWQSLGGTLTSAPAAIARPEGVLSVFARDIFSRVQHISFTPGMGWSTWQSLGAP